MIREFFTACFAVGVAAAADYTQTAPAPSQPPAKETVVTLTGCLKPWDDMAGAPAPSLATPAASGGRRFLLTGVEPAAKDAKPSSRDTTQYVVTAETGVDLDPHVNHTVRVTGSTSAAPATAGATRPTQKWAMLLASSIATVSKTCATATD